MPDIGMDGLASYASSGLQTVGGIAQTIAGLITQRKALKSLESLKTPTYQPNKSINDYFQAAQQRYNTSPYQSAQYNYALQRNRENQATAFAGLRDRRNSLAGAASIINAGNNANMQAGIRAEAQRQSNFGALGAATNTKAGDDIRVFNQNVLAPYQKKFGLLSDKAAAAGQMLNAGLSNTFAGLSNASAIAGANTNQNGFAGLSRADAISNYLPASQVEYAPNYGGIQRNPLSGSYGNWG